ncbi:drug/metabolite transporter (DMT)-like permease [Paenibacillus sp. V4I3]|uniref:DMT family transporter n=1 Tax=unclassified Paenibacillus TaxID=185978 RepID=UPI00278A310E|nr:MULTISPECIES: DMT family transporter [unclassified Paenibacillus]MDQ0878574.1 drug/metabolite transporter (DMT)-like permease [Paenibacillus sp. V4I3]MDQ0885568.1 drug/metabolite transporter (DMT)-like permease [Paenibacillus sp. V4I9]
MNSRKGIKLAYIFAVLNAVIIGFSFLFAKIALDHASPLDTLTYRFAVSFSVLSIPVALGLVKLNYRGKPLIKVFLLATTYPLGFFTLQAYGLLHTSSAEGGILYAFTPIVTMVFASLFLKETTSVLQKLSIFLSVFGVLFIFIMKGSTLNWSNMTGIILLVLTCVAFAGYSVLARSLSKQFSPAELSYFMLGIGFATFLIVSLSSHAGAGTFEAFLSPLSNPSFIVAILFLGLFSSLVTALTGNYVLSKIEASKMSVFTNLSTIVSIVAGALFLGEKVTVYHLIGSVMILTGVIGTQYLGRYKVALPKVKADRVRG